MVPVLRAPALQRRGDLPLHLVIGCRHIRSQSTRKDFCSPLEVETSARAKPPCAWVMSLALALVLLAAPACVDSVFSPKWPGPTIFHYKAQSGSIATRMMSCLEEKWVTASTKMFGPKKPYWNDLRVETSQTDGGATLYIAPVVADEGFKTLSNVFQSLNFTSSPCRRFNKREYKAVLWNEVLLYLVKTGVFNNLQNPQDQRRWDSNDRAVMLLSLYWEFTLPILLHPRRSRFYNFLSGSRLTRWLRAMFVDQIPMRLVQLISDANFNGRLYPLDDDGPYVRACKRAGVSNLGRLFVRKIREYDSIMQQE